MTARLTCNMWSSPAALSLAGLLITGVLLVSDVTGQSGEDFTQLLQDLVTVSGRVRPVRNLSTLTTVYVDFHLMSIIAFETRDQKLVSNGWLQVVWGNEYGTWNPTLYNNAYMVNPDPVNVWRPRLTVLNTLKDLKPMGEDYIIILSIFDGTTMWYPAERFETFCRVDVTYFPFDTQKCAWDMFIWGTDPATVLDLQPIKPNMSVDGFVENGEWQLIDTTVWRTVMEPEGFAQLHYQVTIRRRPSLLALTVLLPVIVLALVNVFVFTIPSEAGERLSYSVTSLLSFGVFMSFIMDAMPSSTETLSIMAVNMSCLLVMSALLVLLCILSLRLFHTDPDKHPVPASLASIIVWLELLVCLDPPANNKVSDVIPIKSLDDHVINGHGVKGSEFVGVRGNKGRLRGKLDRWAEKRKQRNKAYSDPAEMTWQRVSRTVDKLLFRFFFFLVVSTNVAVWVVMVIHFYSVSKAQP